MDSDNINKELHTLREDSDGDRNSNTSCEGMSEGSSYSGILLRPNVNDANYDDENRPYLGYFEGPEKSLEVCFRPAGKDMFSNMESLNGLIGMRRLPREDLDELCSKARCTIMSKISNGYLDAYVLSESSLFVYPHMVVLKTCGTTTLLRCIATLIELGRKVGLEVEWVGYSRKDFSFPYDQQFPHGSFAQEIEYIDSHRHLSEKLNGSAYTLGPVTSDHWFVYVADKTRRADDFTDTDRVLNIMMFDIAEDVSQKFYYDQYMKQIGDDNEGKSKDDVERLVSEMMTKSAGIDTLCPGSKIDPRAFEPCGYSMNAILFRSYSTMHVTPEDGSSYASFETNQKMPSYTALINNVVNTFRPKRFVLTLMADEGALSQIKDIPLYSNTPSTVFVPVKGDSSRKSIDYKRKNLSTIQVEDDCVCMMANFVHDNSKLSEPVSMISKKMRETKIRGMSVQL